MELAARIGTMARRGAPLPYDAEVEYLHGDGNQWIDTLLSPKIFFVSTKLVGYNNGVQYAGVYGAKTSDGTTIYIYNNNSKGFRWVFRNSKGSNQTVGYNALVEVNNWQANFGKDLTHSIGVFANYVDDAIVQSRIPTDFYFFKMSTDASGTDLIFDAIPVRFTNEDGETEGAMYDRVSGKLFRNQGTGAFTIGPDKTV